MTEDEALKTLGHADKRYVLCPGFVTSRKDRQTHFIGASRLAYLYGVSLRDCVILQLGEDPRLCHLPPGSTLLHPRHYGDYREHLAFLRTLGTPSLPPNQT